MGAGFFITVSPPSMLGIGKHCAANGKTYCLNLSAPFIPQFFKDPLAEVMPYVDFLFGNESEAAVYGKTNGLGEDLEAVALAIAAKPKASGTRPWVVVFTQGKDPTIIACGGVFQHLVRLMSTMYEFKIKPNFYVKKSVFMLII